MTANPEAAQGLTIGDLARRTGLSPATLRAWESRHGFPRPQRLASGHRRYDEQDVALVRQVLRRRDAGVRLESAITEAAAARGTPVASVFAEVRRRQPQLLAQRLRKSTLLALTWAMEDECCARAERPVLFAAFQHQRYFSAAASRWAELARTSRSTVVFADFGGVGEHHGRAAADGAVLVHLPAEAPMRREWSLVCDAPGHAAALAAWELPGQRGVRDSDRLFESVWTLEPQAVRNAARTCAGLAAQLSPDLQVDLGDLDSTPPEASDDLRTATTMFGRLLGYVDRYR